MGVQNTNGYMGYMGMGVQNTKGYMGYRGMGVQNTKGYMGYRGVHPTCLGQHPYTSGWLIRYTGGAFVKIVKWGDINF